MASAYAAFLQAPNTSQLASDASLNYITTTTTINEPAAILKHLASQQKLLEKKGEKVLHAIESADCLFLETETTLKFLQGGGAFLPSVDENLLDEKVVAFPLLHVVSFDADRKIKQIRLHWDQGSLLKQVEAIGRTGRNWPIRDGKAQLDAITKSVKAHPDVKTPLGSRNPNEVVINQTSKRDTMGALRNQPASLSLFAPRDPNDNDAGEFDGPITSPRASARPAPRDLGELFVGEETAATTGSGVRSSSPSKAEGVVFKSGAGKHYGDIRLFDENDEANDLKSPQRKKTYDQKYAHFSFGEGEDAPEVASPPSSRGRGKGHQPTFSFEDFTTPMKYAPRKRPDDEVHWGAEEDPPSPPLRPIVHAARKDANTHFDITDEATPAQPGKQAKSLQRQAGTNLYHDPLEMGDDTPIAASRHYNTTSVDNGRRSNDFGAHYEISDTLSNKFHSNDENQRPNSKRGTRSEFDQHWTWGTPEAEKKIYKTAGDGMGRRKGGQAFSIGGEEGDA